MSQFRRIAAFDTTRLLKVTVGLGLLLAGLTIYSNHGFQSSDLFFLGLLMVPLGLIVLGNTLVRIPPDGET